MAEDILYSLTPQISKRNISAQAEGEGCCWAVPDDMRQLLKNIIENAVNTTPTAVRSRWSATRGMKLAASPCRTPASASPWSISPASSSGFTGWTKAVASGRGGHRFGPFHRQARGRQIRRADYPDQPPLMKARSSKCGCQWGKPRPAAAIRRNHHDCQQNLPCLFQPNRDYPADGPGYSGGASHARWRNTTHLGDPSNPHLPAGGLCDPWASQRTVGRYPNRPWNGLPALHGQGTPSNRIPAALAPL